MNALIGQNLMSKLTLWVFIITWKWDVRILMYVLGAACCQQIHWSQIQHSVWGPDPMLVYQFIQDPVFLQINTEIKMQGYDELAIFIRDSRERKNLSGMEFESSTFWPTSSGLADLTPCGLFDSFCLAHQGPNWYSWLQGTLAGHLNIAVGPPTYP